VNELYPNLVIELFLDIFLSDSRRLRLQENLVQTPDGFTMSGRVDYLVGGLERPDDPGAIDSVIVPFLWGAKGRLYSNLVVTNSSGRRLTLLPQAQVTAMIGLAIETPLRTALDIGPDVALTETQRAVLRNLGALISIPEPVEPSDYLGMFEKIVVPLDVAADRLDEVRKLVEFFADGYVLAVEMPAARLAHRTLDYSYSDPPETSRSSVSGLFGLDSPHQAVELAAAATLFHSYHLVLEGRVGSYARSTQLYRKGADGKLRPDRSVRHRERRFSNSSVHLHIDQPSTERPRLTWQVTYEEIPPGSLPPIITMAFTNFLVALVLGFTTPLIENPIDFNAPTLMLAIPIFAITVFGFSFDRLVRSSIQAAVAYLLSATLTTASTLLSVLGQPRTDAPGRAILGAFRPVLGHPAYPPLLACALLSLLLMGGVAVLLLYKVWCYRRR
ncbi:MAG: hypothetical protein M3O65_10515, partial [Actinomycetota bacterium]|nr:hypothetical protein [Actinomycetota bacterium]